MPVLGKDLWSLVSGRPEVDPHELAEAVALQVEHGSLDYRSRLLIRDSVAALQEHWGEERLAAWLANSPVRQEIEAICREGFERPGFPSLPERLMDKTDPEDIRQFLREVGVHLPRPLRVDVGGSGALILAGYLSRKTDDIDIVDEVPAEVRSQHQLLARLRQRYGLSLTHFQSHYLPSGWAQRLHSQAPFGQLQVYLVDVHDVLLSKLNSNREKDRDDLRAVAPQLDKDTLVRKLKETAGPLLASPELRRQAEHNWYILYGEPLPS
jgi:Nucleotidyltransferase of unknown function (DUF6036)